jgi:hypothetical protein
LPDTGEQVYFGSGAIGISLSRKFWIEHDCELKELKSSYCGASNTDIDRKLTRTIRSYMYIQSIDGTSTEHRTMNMLLSISSTNANVPWHQQSFSFASKCSTSRCITLPDCYTKWRVSLSIDCQQSTEWLYTSMWNHRTLINQRKERTKKGTSGNITNIMVDDGTQETATINRMNATATATAPWSANSNSSWQAPWSGGNGNGPWQQSTKEA